MMNSIDAEEVEEILMAKENYAFARRVYEMYPQALKNFCRQFLQKNLAEAWKRDVEGENLPLKPIEKEDKYRIWKDFVFQDTMPLYVFSLHYPENYFDWGLWLGNMTENQAKEKEEVIALTRQLISTPSGKDSHYVKYPLEDMLLRPEEVLKEFTDFVKQTAPKLQEIFKV